MHTSTTSAIGDRKYIREDAGLPEQVYLRPYSSDGDVYSQVIVKHEYSSVSDIFDQYFKTPARNIVDCGGNIGLTTVYFSQCYPDARFVTVEPMKDNIETMKLNFSAAGLRNFKLIEGGVWSEDCTLVVNEKFRDGKEWSFSLRPGMPGESGIPSYSLLEIVDSFDGPVDILKIDVEGTEKVLFSDPSYSAAFLQKVKCLAIEIHDEFDCRQQIYDAFRASNFFYYNIKDMTIAVNRNYA
jgi:FkbM family methyltransferase